MLTHTACRDAKPAEKPYKLADGRGLYLEVKPNGVKAWRYRFKLSADGAAKESVYAIGEFGTAPITETSEAAQARRDGGVFTLAEARDERARARALVKQGINPAHHRQKARQRRIAEQGMTFEVLAKQWLDSRDWTADTKAERLRMLERTTFRRIGGLPVREIESPAVLALLKQAAKVNGPTVARQAKSTIYRIFELAREDSLVTVNPVLAWQESLPKNKTQHKRALTPEEIGQLLRDIAAYDRNYQTVGALQLIWLTLCRPNEAVGARWEEFNLDAGTWTIPKERMKAREEHQVPMSRQAVELMTRLKAASGSRSHVFRHRDDRESHMTDAALRRALAAIGWTGRFSPHAARTTGSTILNEMGYSSDWIERQLAHAEPSGVRRAYNHAAYLARRAEMMQQWANLLDAWQHGSSKVVPMRAA